MLTLDNFSLTTRIYTIMQQSSSFSSFSFSFIALYRGKERMNKHRFSYVFKNKHTKNKTEKQHRISM